MKYLYMGIVAMISLMVIFASGKVWLSSEHLRIDSCRSYYIKVPQREPEIRMDDREIHWLTMPRSWADSAGYEGVDWLDMDVYMEPKLQMGLRKDGVVVWRKVGI